jgi:hypothetical protein
MCAVLIQATVTEVACGSASHFVRARAPVVQTMCMLKYYNGLESEQEHKSYVGEEILYKE